jgi:hypothetical protein
MARRWPLTRRGEEEALLIAASGQLPEGGDDSHPVEGFVPDW